MWVKLHRLFVGLIASRLAQSPGPIRQQETRNTGKDKCQAPLTNLRKFAANDKTDQDTDELSYAPPTHNTRSFGKTKIIAHQCGASRKITRFTNAQHHT